MWDKSPVLFADVVEKDAVTHVKKISKDMIGRLVDQSPIDTTQFVSNHNVSLDAPNWSHNPNKLLGDRGSESEGLATIAAMPANKLRDVWFTNATPYGEELEGGKSRQPQAAGGIYLPTFLAVSQWYKG